MYERHQSTLDITELGTRLTTGLIERLGMQRYRRWVGQESFVEAARSRVRSRVAVGS